VGCDGLPNTEDEVDGWEPATVFVEDDCVVPKLKEYAGLLCVSPPAVLGAVVLEPEAVDGTPKEKDGFANPGWPPDVDAIAEPLPNIGVVVVVGFDGALVLPNPFDGLVAALLLVVPNTDPVAGVPAGVVENRFEPVLLGAPKADFGVVGTFEDVEGFAAPPNVFEVAGWAVAPKLKDGRVEAVEPEEDAGGLDAPKLEEGLDGSALDDTAGADGVAAGFDANPKLNLGAAEAPVFEAGTAAGAAEFAGVPKVPAGAGAPAELGACEVGVPNDDVGALPDEPVVPVGCWELVGTGPSLLNKELLGAAVDADLSPWSNFLVSVWLEPKIPEVVDGALNEKEGCDCIGLAPAAPDVWEKPPAPPKLFAGALLIGVADVGFGPKLKDPKLVADAVWVFGG